MKKEEGSEACFVAAQHRARGKRGKKRKGVRRALLLRNIARGEKRGKRRKGVPRALLLCTRRVVEQREEYSVYLHTQYIVASAQCYAVTGARSNDRTQHNSRPHAASVCGRAVRVSAGPRHAAGMHSRVTSILFRQTLGKAPVLGRQCHAERLLRSA